MQGPKFVLWVLIAGLTLALLQQKPNASRAQDLPKPDGALVGCSIIDPLDDCIQALFSKVDSRFGMARVPTATKHLTYFNPRNDEERAVVNDLDHSGWVVAFYLAGRRILGERPGPNKTPFAGRRHSVIGGPIAITPAFSGGGQRNQEFEMPEPDQLWEDAQNAMRSFETKNQYDFSVGGWKVEARPIRAGESCLKCHNNNQGTSPSVVDLYHAPSGQPIKVGDALGVAMYAYTRKK
jgi:hypothetical protein